VFRTLRGVTIFACHIRVVSELTACKVLASCGQANANQACRLALRKLSLAPQSRNKETTIYYSRDIFYQTSYSQLTCVLSGEVYTLLGQRYTLPFKSLGSLRKRKKNFAEAERGDNLKLYNVKREGGYTLPSKSLGSLRNFVFKVKLVFFNEDNIK